ncbi:hypothetical protein BC834DRAFT_271490 [Gloeopeniophorella convolvens]|nr:hypothetical protein BC834DRAFT_271490 [Gloeopeniophorella convolvens]
MSDSPSQVVETAGYDDYFNYSDADLIVKSSDGVSFKAYRVILEKSSSVLAARLLEQSTLPLSLTQSRSSELAQSPAAPTDGTATLPVLTLPEDASTIRSLFSVILPAPISLPPSFEHAVSVLVAAKKYKAEAALSILRAYLEKDIDRMVKHDDAFRAFCLAHNNGLLREALVPARIALDLPMTMEGLGDKLQYATGTSLHDMMDFRKRVQDHLSRSVNELRKSGELRTAWSHGCAHTLPGGTPGWIDEVLITMVDPSSIFPIFDQSRVYSALHNHVQKTNCQCCADVPAATKAIFWSAISLRMRTAISQAEEEFLSQRESPRQFEFPIPTGDLAIEVGPYHDCGTADVIIRSSDGKDFLVHKFILSSSSLVFRDMFSLQDVDSPAGTTSTVPVVEHSRVLGTLFSLLYLRSRPKIDSYDIALHLLATTQKYQMDGVTELIRYIVENQREPLLTLAREDLFRQYAFATRRSLAQEAKFLAMHTVDRFLTFKEIGDSLYYLEGPALYALLQYRKRCRDIIDSRLQSFINLTSPIALKLLEFSQQSITAQSRRYGVVDIEIRQCKSCIPHSNKPAWWHNLLSQLQKDVVSGARYPLIQLSSIQRRFYLALSAHLNKMPLCLVCATTYSSRGDQFCVALDKELKEAIKSVSAQLFL